MASDLPPGRAPRPQSVPPAQGDPTLGETNRQIPPTLAPGGEETVGLPLAPGGRPIPDYELVCLLGRGGFGEVWKAVGPGGFAVALKFIRLDGQGGRVELRSLELMKGIRHAHLLPMFGAWQRGAHLVIAMELAERTLLDRLRQAQGEGLPGVPPPELLESMHEAAKGIDFLNEPRHLVDGGRPVGIQHKDIKPQNLLLVGGCVKVADFGLAKLLENTSTAASGGMTVSYAAPEFFSGRATRWSDQYALAVTYCQLRSGRLPFEGPPAQVMAGHVTRPPDLAMLPEAERPAVARALAKRPEDRWPSCRAFVEALAACALPGRALGDAPTLPAGARPARGRRGLLVAAGAALFALAVAVGSQWSGLLDGPGAVEDGGPPSGPPAGPPPAAGGPRATPPAEEHHPPQGAVRAKHAVPAEVFQMGWKFGLNLRARRGGKADFKDAPAYGVEVYLDRDNDRLVYVTETAAVGAGPADRLSPGPGVKNPEWRNGLDLRVRGVGEADFTTKTKKFGSEVFRDLNGGNLVYISEMGTVAVSPAALPSPDGARNPTWFHGLELKARRAGAKEFTKATRTYGLEVYRDEITNHLCYMTDSGAVAVVAARAGGRPAAIKAPTWLHGFEVPVRKGNERTFTADTRRYGVEVYRDENADNLVYISEAGFIAVVPVGGAAGPGGGNTPTHLSGRSYRVRKAAEADFTRATALVGVELYRDENTGNRVYISEPGSLAVVQK